MTRPRGVPVLDGSHVSRWDVPDWIDPRGHYAYTAWSRAHPEEALYVGVSSRILTRLAEHAAGSAWWGEADHIDLRAFASRADAKAAEADGIRRFDPHYNSVRPGDAVHGDGCAICLAGRPSPSTVCFTCGRPAAGSYRDGSPRFDCRHVAVTRHRLDPVATA
jgi:hypothetical protein